MIVIYMLISLFIIATISFFIMKMLSGSPLSAADKLSPEQREVVMDKYNLNDPVPVQYVRYLANLAQGDLGLSFAFDNTPVSKILMDRIGPSIQLGAQALIIGTFLGILFGLIAAISHNGVLDYSSTVIRSEERRVGNECSYCFGRDRL